jgi:hypothetical protein
MLTGLKDVDREVLKHVDDRQLLKICSIDKKTWHEVCDDGFLQRRLSKYPDIEKYKKENESWKQFFLRAVYYISKMKEDFEFSYDSGDFQLQYKLLAKYDGNLNSLLIASSRKGQLSLVKYALEKGVNVSVEENYALRHAAWKGHLNVVKYLAEHGADIHVEEDEPLRKAAIYGHLDVVKYLIEKGADVHAEGDDPLIYASINGHLNVVKYLVENGVDPVNNIAIKYATEDVHKYLKSFK